MVPELQRPLSARVFPPVVDGHEGPVPDPLPTAIMYPGGQQLGRGAEGGEEGQADVPAAGRLEADVGLEVLHAAHTGAADGKCDVPGRTLPHRPTVSK